ncbi:tyrosine-type recombinase/integrase [Collinsella intestinalis]
MPTAHEYLAPCIRQRKDGRLQAYSKYKDAQGEWKQKSCLIPQSITSKRSAKKYANEWWRELRASEPEYSPALINSTPASPHQHITRYTVTEMIRFMLDDKLTSGVIERSTYSKEMTTLRRVEQHPIGAMDIDSVTEADCLEFFRYLIRDRGLCINSVRVSQLQLKSAYWYFLRERRTANNPMQFIKLFPKQRPVPNAVTRNESLAFFKAASKLKEGSRYHAVVWLAFYTGMREAEIAALQWRNVDMETGYINVCQSIGKDDAHREVYNDTYLKTTKSRNTRIIPLNPILIDILRKRFQYQTIERNGVEPSAQTFVVGFPDDRYIRPQSISVWWRRFSKNNNLTGNQGRRLKFHDIRHGFATNMLSEGADVNSVASIMGHSDPSITLSLYASPDTQAIKTAMNTAGLFSGFGTA